MNQHCSCVTTLIVQLRHWIYLSGKTTYKPGYFEVFDGDKMILLIHQSLTCHPGQGYSRKREKKKYPLTTHVRSKLFLTFNGAGFRLFSSGHLWLLSRCYFCFLLRVFSSADHTARDSPSYLLSRSLLLLLRLLQCGSVKSLWVRDGRQVPRRQPPRAHSPGLRGLVRGAEEG